MEQMLTLKGYFQRLAICFGAIFFFFGTTSVASMFIDPRYDPSKYDVISGVLYNYRELPDTVLLAIVWMISFWIVLFNYIYINSISRDYLQTFAFFTNQKHQREYKRFDERNAGWIFSFVLVVGGLWAQQQPFWADNHSIFKDWRSPFVIASLSFADFWNFLGWEISGFSTLVLAFVASLTVYRIVWKLNEIRKSIESRTTLYVPFSLAGKWGFTSGAEHLAVRPRYDDVYVRQNSWDYEPLIVKAGDKFGYVAPGYGPHKTDAKDFEFIPPKYDRAEFFSEGFAKVNLNGKWGKVDKNGKEYWDK